METKRSANFADKTMVDENWRTVVVETKVEVQVSSDMEEDEAFEAAESLVDDVVAEQFVDVGGIHYQGVDNMEYED